ncbi:hypothetical protein ECC02_007605 [Trypanosoma cruzi]|uniref:Uncharacterized protein n=1 Tax=Trypanosoma cruzi TaxID=5693 RepID=A0A7J6XZR2_TRYCR|nr:hypothetical protein ECC02_007605 [Trypanosoma cruzi]
MIRIIQSNTILKKNKSFYKNKNLNDKKKNSMKSSNTNSVNIPQEMAKNPGKKKLLMVQMQLQLRTTVTAAPWSPTPPTLFCFFLLLLRVRLLLRWWPRESEGERAVHRPHTHSSFTHSLCVSPCMDSRPHLTPRGTHIMCPLYICMHTHAGPLVLSFARHAPLPSCLAAWAEHRNCFCFVFIALSGRPLSLSLSPCVCVLLYGSNESVCAGRPTLLFGFLVCSLPNFFPFNPSSLLFFAFGAITMDVFSFLLFPL